MKKQLVLIGLLFLMSCGLGLFADNHIRLGGGAGIPNAVFIFRPGPIDLKVGYDFTPDKNFIFFSGDYRIVNNRWITSVFYLSVGLGGYGKIVNLRQNAQFEWGLRIPVAFQVFLWNDFVEIFLEASPGIDLYPKAQFSEQPIQIWLGATLELD